VAVVVVIVIVFVSLWAAGLFNPSSSPGGGGSGSAPASHSENIVNTQNQQFGPTFTNAGAYGFTVPSNALGAWVNGTFSVTTCTSIGDYCLAFAEIATPSAWANQQSGGSVTVIWCTTTTSQTCQAEQNAQVASGDLSGYAGQSLDLIFYSGASTLSQAYAADVTLTYLTPS